MHITQRTENGWPVIEWTSEVPTGKSVYQYDKEMTLKIAVVIGLFAGGLAFFHGEGIGISFFVFLIVMGFALGSGKSLEGMQLPGGGRVPVTPGPTDAEKRREAIQRATQMMTKATASVSVRPGSWPSPSEPPTLLFVSKIHQPPMQEIKFELPFDAVSEFMYGTKEQWYGKISERHATHISQDADTHVIVAPTAGYGVILIAKSGGEKAEIAGLHGMLVATFLSDRRKLVKRFEDSQKARAA